MSTGTSNQEQGLAGHDSGNEHAGRLQNPKLDSARRKSTEGLLRQIFTQHYKESPATSNEELTQEVNRAFQLFRSEFNGLVSPNRNDDKERKIREQISNLQKRTSETLEVLSKCKENVGSVVFLDTKPELSVDIDEPATPESRSLSKLSEEIEKLQAGVPSSPITPIQRPDIEDVKIATDRLLHDLGRISKNYTSDKKSSWLSKISGRRQ